ncbi:MAG: glycoside hydrolase family 3 N-terminal domain-containing protein [Gaiellaceae bacterium]|jgi:beta-glucosidase
MSPETPDAIVARDWQNTDLPIEDRVKALLDVMTLEEKVGQLGSVWLGSDRAAGNDAPMEGFRPLGTWEEMSQHGLGQLTRVFGTEPLDPDEAMRRLAALQLELLSRTRLGVPAMAHEECLTGFMTYGATIFPTPLALAATFDPALVERMTVAIGEVMRRAGVHQALGPVLDVVRDYRWGRVEETFGEDPYLGGMIGAAYVRGLESVGIVATLKHFAGNSSSSAGRNLGPVSIGRRELADIILPPFELALKHGGARAVMNSYTAVDGLAAGADPDLLTTTLREQWGFDGTVVADYWSITFLATMHHLAASAGEAGALALAAGIDVELPNARCYGPDLIALVRNRRLSETLIDRAVGRVLRQKAQLGLLDVGWSPESPRSGEPLELDPPAHRALAREIAERSVILLANTGVLPLATAVRRIAVVGPCAADPATFLGCYSFPTHVRARIPNVGLGVEVPSLVAALGREVPEAELLYARGCPISELDLNGIPEAVKAVQTSELAIVAVGDLSGNLGVGTSGEGNDVEDLTLPGVQAELLNRVLETGVPAVLVVVSGRPYALGAFAGRAAAIIQAFLPGEEGGAAIAGVLSGRVNPSGRLPVQIPARPGGQPGTYLHPLLGESGLGHSSIDSRPLYPFGHGLSYTTFAYTDLALAPETIPTDGQLTISCTVTNTGARSGADTVQLYIEDPVAEAARPMQQLAGFARLQLDPGQTARVQFTLHADRLAYTGRPLNRIVDPGEIRVAIGPSSADRRLEAAFMVTGPTRPVGATRRLTTPIKISYS